MEIARSQRLIGSMGLRVAIDVRHIRDFGIGTYIRNLVHGLAAIDTETHYLLASAYRDVPEFAALPQNFELATFKRPRQRYWEHVSYPWFLRSLRANVVHMPLNEVPLLMPQPYVVTVHDMSNLLFGQASGLRENYHLFRFRRGLLRARGIIAVSDATQRDVEKLLGIPRGRIRLVYSAPDPRFFARDTGPDAELGREQQLERFQIQRPFVLYAGRIRPHKNVPKLIEAFAVVRNELENHPPYHDLRLVIIGDEISRHPEVRRAVVQTRSQHAVRFLGFLPFETLKIFYSSASVFAFPSLYEGFGLPPLEAMASGTPVLTSNVSSLPEVVGSAALVINPENVFDIARGIREILLDKDLREHLVSAGFQQAMRFNWRRTAEETLQVYRDVSGTG